MCTKAAGLVDRSSIRQLAISGPEALLDHVLAAAVPAGVPSPGRAVCIAGTWCCRTTARRAIVAGGPERGGPLAPGREPGDLHRRPGGERRAARRLRGAVARWVRARPGSSLAAGLPADLGVGEVADGSLAGSPVTVVREDGDHFLLLFEHGHPTAVWQALWEAGHEYGLAPVGNEALELLQAAHRPID